jgi:hypothetical protein
MSYYAMDRAMYQNTPAGTPGWQQGPVPGWGINPYRAGPARVGVGCASCAVSGFGAEPDSYYTMTSGHVMLAGVGGFLLGMLTLYIWDQAKAKK